ncbi:hypothetical protein TNCV_2652621 [Trichonephila clavipes]|nr:hypothetical protein TNCV_2652621 [Trichonephila clavipes]
MYWIIINIAPRGNRSGRGSLVVKVTDSSKSSRATAKIPLRHAGGGLAIPTLQISMPCNSLHEEEVGSLIASGLEPTAR